MRTRKQAADCEPDPHFGDLLQNLHESSNGAQHLDDSVDKGPPQTLGDVSKQSVSKLLNRVGVRRAAAKKRQFEQEQQLGSKRRKGRGKPYTEDDLLHQHPVSSASAPVCGALAKTSRDAESSHTANSSLNSRESSDSKSQSLDPGDGSDVNMVEDLQEGTEDDEELEWEQGEETYAGVTADGEGSTENGWTGDITVQVENKAEKRKAAQRKPPVRRANNRDKEFAELVHKAHLLCLLGRGRMVDEACDDSLLQASILSVLPPSVSLLGSSGGSSIILLRTFVSWFCSTFQFLSPENGISTSTGHGDLSTRLLEVAQKQGGTAEEVAAISVAFLRGLGFTTRYVTSLHVAPLKPDASSLEASAGWDPRLDGDGIVYSAHKDLEALRVSSLARLLAHSAFEQDSNGHLSASKSPLVDSTVPSARASQKVIGGDIDKSNIGARKYDSVGQRDNSDTGKNMQDREEKAEVKAYSRRKRRSGETAGGSHEGTSARVAVAKVSYEMEGLTPLGNKGDEEFETQVAVAMCATAAGAGQKSNNEPLVSRSPLAINRSNGVVRQKKKLAGKLKKIVGMSARGESSSKNVAVNRMGAPLHWAEIYLFEENSGRWVHVDAARGWFNGADKVEGSAVAGRVPLRYVVAFAGSGAKDVTRRYVGMWSSVSALRVDEGWWASTLHPLKQLEAAATAGATLRQVQAQNIASSSQGARETAAVPEDFRVVDSRTQRRLPIESDDKPVPNTQTQQDVCELKKTGKRAARTLQPKRNISAKEPTAPGVQSAAHHAVDRSSLEDMELETKTYTEPLPTSQQAYKSHHLYALERWLTKYQTLHPKGPVLGYCAGQPVYPRTCVQILHTPDRWLREGLKVKEGEIAAKIVKANHLAGKSVKQAALELDADEEKPPPPTTELFGKWQCAPWRPPRAVNGIVPKNERGQVDCWSEYCIPPGTVHLRYPRLVPIVKRLGIDFAPAMVGFEIRKRRSVPMYEGVVVCQEFRDLIMDAYKQEEEIRFGQLRKKREDMAIRRWRELLHSMATRERLKATYEGFPLNTSESKKTRIAPKKTTHSRTVDNANKMNVAQKEVAHEHHFPEEDQTFDDETGTRTKVCACGFTVRVEEM